ELGLDRSQVVTILHGLVGGEVIQDNAYRWWPKARGPRTANGDAPAPRTFLTNICRYYLECVSRESGAGISIPAADDDAYVVLSDLPFARKGDELSATDHAVRRIVQKVRRERGQLKLYIGYAIRLRSVVMHNQDEMRIE